MRICTRALVHIRRLFVQEYQILQRGMGCLTFARAFQYITTSCPNAYQQKYYLATMSTSNFHEKADEFIENIQDLLSIIEEKVDDCDITLGDGVLNIKLGSIGHWVINKQTPNTQLWWSSPISGPLRFEFVDGKWKCTRDESMLVDLLRKEVLQVTGIDIFSTSRS